MDREERMVENQISFRHANEVMKEQMVDAGTVDHRHVPFFCECADGDCLGRLNATLEEFEDAHLSSDHYFILPGHVRVVGEESIEENGRYEVVIKEGR
jgi:hypothetical protein